MDLRDNKEFMLAAVTQNGRALEFVLAVWQHGPISSQSDNQTIRQC